VRLFEYTKNVVRMVTNVLYGIKPKCYLLHKLNPAQIFTYTHTHTHTHTPLPKFS